MNNIMINKQHHGEAKVISMISSREREVLGLIASGLNNQEIGEKLFISSHTAVAHRKNLYRKLGAYNGATLVQRAYELGIIKSNPQTVDNDIISIREREVLQLISSGLKSNEIASRLYISSHTVDSHKKNLYKKLYAYNSAALMNKAFEVGLLSC